MNLSVFHLFLVILIEIRWAQCKNILAIFSHFGKSHFVMYEAYVRQLAERGHTITLVTAFNVTDVHDNIKSISFENEDTPFRFNLNDYEAAPKFLLSLYELNYLNEMGQKSCSLGLTNPKVQKLAKSNEKFDAVIVEYFNTDCFAVFAHIFKAPLIGIFSSPPLPWHNDRMGNPDNPSYISTLFTDHTSHMNFFSRLKNAVSLVYYKTYYKIYYEGPTDRMIRRHLGKGIPKVNDIVSETSLFLINSHHTLFYPRPLVPGVVEVGGLHVQDPRKLPSDLNEYLTNSDQGVVYFSLGTVVDETTIPEKKRKAIVGAFGKLQQNVLWKWKGDQMSDKTKNVLLKPWVPQNDVLAHPNVKVFVSHGGLMGMMEAVTQGVPMVVIPFFGDQFHNAAFLAEKGSAVVLDYFTLTEAKLLRAINAVLEDKRYTENAKRLAVKFKERPLTAMNSAVYWTEYVLKFRGAQHLRPANTSLSWFSEWLLDVQIFIGFATFFIVHFGKKALLSYREHKKGEESQKKKKK